MKPCIFSFFGNFQFHQDIAFENAVIENQVDEIMGVADQAALLPRLETEVVTQLNEAIAQLAQELIFEMGFAHGLLRFQARKLEHIRVMDGKS